jgi:fatty-acyl-CoA synthase
MVLHSLLDHWAARQPDQPAIINATRHTQLTWAQLRDGSLILAAALRRLGFRQGDFLATSLPFTNEHIQLEYACFRLGVIHVPLDLRLQPEEVERCLKAIGAREHIRSNEWIEALLRGALEPVDEPVLDTGGAQVIFTTGSTGSPKPALLSHAGIALQNHCLGRAFEFDNTQRILVNLPPSHVGGQAELLLTCLYYGGTAVVLEVFDPVKSLEAIERYQVTLVGQIPAMFHMEWRTAGYDQRNFSSLRSLLYGGQSVPRPFLDRMLTMGPRIATGLGLTEASGFCTYTPLTGDAGLIDRAIGLAAREYPMAIREPMHSDGTAGAELPSGTVGHVCFRGPQNFLGYVNNPAATAQAISGDGWLYTGDMGSVDAEGLHFCGRAKFMLKPAGYQVFPGDVENHISRLAEKVAGVGVVGQPHQIWTEGIIAFVEKRPGAELSATELRRHARSLTSYMRPLHYVILDPGSLPLNRTAKVDTIRLQEWAKDEVQRLRDRGRWDGEESDDEAS